jgi:hypothetical protein
MKRAKTVKLIISLVLVVGFTVTGIYDYRRGKDKRLVYGHRNEHHPVIKELFARKIRQGQTADELLASNPPTSFSRHHNFLTFHYVKNNEKTEPCCGGYSIYIRIIAIDNRLVKALAVEGVLSEIEYVFFNEMDQATEDFYWTSRMRYIMAKK